VKKRIRNASAQAAPSSKHHKGSHATVNHASTKHTVHHQQQAVNHPQAHHHAVNLPQGKGKGKGKGKGQGGRPQPLQELGY
jgi:hypothetical protein